VNSSLEPSPSRRLRVEPTAGSDVVVEDELPLTELGGVELRWFEAAVQPASVVSANATTAAMRLVKPLPFLPGGP